MKDTKKLQGFWQKLVYLIENRLKILKQFTQCSTEYGQQQIILKAIQFFFSVAKKDSVKQNGEDFKRNFSI